jgi:hypothetical protein
VWSRGIVPTTFLLAFDAFLLFKELCDPSHGGEKKHAPLLFARICANGAILGKFLDKEFL